ncbi:hypothetical protein JCM9279_001378 [Rhodotorula babjevae]
MLAAMLLLATAAAPSALALPVYDAGALSPRGLPLLAERDSPDVASSAAASLIAYFPKLTSPTRGSEWQAGGVLEVAWNATRPDYPDSQLHKFASVYLGYLDDSDPGSGYNLDFENPIGNVSFYDGSGTAQLPLPADLPTRSTYLITMGSTNNISPPFKIEGAAAASPPSSAAASSSSSSAAAASSALASSTTKAQIGAPAVTVYFPDGQSTVLGGESSAAAPTGASSAPASQETGLRDIAASSSAAVESASASPAAATTTSAAASGVAPSAAAAAAETTPATSGAGRSLVSGASVALAGALAFLAL